MDAFHGVISCDTCLTTVTQPPYSLSYTLRLSNDLGCVVADDINIQVERSWNIFIPNAFSPNADGINDYLKPYASQSVAATKRFQIFNRWGDLVFSTENTDINIQGWNGTFMGKNQSSGVYLYQLEVELLDGKTEMLSGEVLLIR